LIKSARKKKSTSAEPREDGALTVKGARIHPEEYCPISAGGLRITNNAISEMTKPGRGKNRAKKHEWGHPR